MSLGDIKGDAGVWVVRTLAVVRILDFVLNQARSTRTSFELCPERRFMLLNLLKKLQCLAASERRLREVNTLVCIKSAT